VASYHFHTQPVSRGSGHSAIAGVAYRIGQDLFDERTQERKDYSRRDGVDWWQHFTPKDAPEAFKNVQDFWNAVEANENRKDARLARDFDAAFPHELTAEQRQHMVTDFVREAFLRKGKAATVAIHAPHQHGDERNFHVHIMVNDREITAQGFSNTKDRTMNSKETLEHWREKWAELGARQLKRAGHEQEAERWKHGHQTLEQQKAAALKRGDIEHAKQCEREPSEHKGRIVSEMEKRGAEPDRAASQRERDQEQKELEAMKQQRQILSAEINKETAFMFNVNSYGADALRKGFRPRMTEPQPELKHGMPPRPNSKEQTQDYSMEQGGVAADWWTAARARMDYQAEQNNTPKPQAEAQPEPQKTRAELRDEELKQTRGQRMKPDHKKAQAKAAAEQEARILARRQQAEELERSHGRGGRTMDR
jgi:hypothetical protein